MTRNLTRGGVAQMNVGECMLGPDIEFRMLGQELDSSAMAFSRTPPPIAIHCA